MEQIPLNGTTTTQRGRCRNMRSWGKRRFILRVGVIGFGGWMFLVMTAYDFLRHHRPYSATDYFFVIALNLVIWPLVGYGFGRSLWGLYYDPETSGK